MSLYAIYGPYTLCMCIYSLVCPKDHVHAVNWQLTHRQSQGTDSQPQARLTHTLEADLLEWES